MASVGEFLLVALVVTFTLAGNSVGVLMWGVLSAVGVSSLILASRIAFDALRIGGALVLIALGVRSLLHRDGTPTLAAPRPRAGWRAGLVTSVSNPKLAVFFVALFPQFLHRGSPVLPYALGMAGAIVVLDVIWFSFLTFAIVQARHVMQPRAKRVIERVSGSIMIGLGLRIAAEAR